MVVFIVANGLVYGFVCFSQMNYIRCYLTFFLKGQLFLIKNKI